VLPSEAMQGCSTLDSTCGRSSRTGLCDLATGRSPGVDACVTSLLKEAMNRSLYTHACCNWAGGVTWIKKGHRMNACSFQPCWHCEGTCFGSWKLIVFVALKLVPCRSHAFSPQHFGSLPSANHNGRDEIGAGHWKIGPCLPNANHNGRNENRPKQWPNRPKPSDGKSQCQWWNRPKDSLK